MKKTIKQLVRPTIEKLKPYNFNSTSELSSKDGTVLLDKNENPFTSSMNRFPDPTQKALKEALAAVKKVKSKQLFLGNGREEVLDVLVRVFCEKNEDKIAALKPNEGLYALLAEINAIELIEVPLEEDFSINSTNVLKEAKGAKLLFLCSPNNPTGNLLNRNELLKIIEDFEGVVVIDESYIDFSNGKSLIIELEKYPNLVIIHSLSHAYGMAGLCLGMAIASEEIIHYLNKVKLPNTLNSFSQNLSTAGVNDLKRISEQVMQILLERSRVLAYLANNEMVSKIYRTDANFVLFKVNDSAKLVQFFEENNILVHDASDAYNCSNCLRMTIGTYEENERFMMVFSNYKE